MLILLVEDNPGDVILVREALASLGLGHHLEVLRDGEEALAWLARCDGDPESQMPALILLDLNLPKRTGMEVLHAVRQGERWREVPVMVVSSSDNDADRREVARLGATAYFRKPSDLDEFLQLGETVGRLLQRPERSLNSVAG
ncbi:MAG: response regulator [Bryobacterales bacterium]|nr:response regulator [Bryobacterales bacterium]